MNWTKASAVAEILSSVAVVITLVYLLIELNQNTDALEASTRQAALDNSMQILQTGIDSPDLWLSRVKQELNDAERIRLSASLFQVARRSEVAWRQYQAGALDEAGWIYALRPLTGTFRYTQPRKWWDYYGPSYPQDFQNVVNEALADVEVIDYLEDIRAFD